MSNGTVRIGINFGNVLLANKDEDGSPSGIAPELARELARRLGKDAEFVTYDSAGRMADGAKNDEWDIAFLATDPARAEEIIFTAPYLEVHTTYLVQSDSQIVDVAEIDRPGIRISVSKKSAYDLFLSRQLTHATLVRANTPGESVDLFFAEQLHALAGLRPFLIGVAARHPGTRLLDGSFMTVQQAVGVSKRSPSSVAKVQEFVEDIKRSGFVAKTIEKYGVKGASVAP